MWMVFLTACGLRDLLPTGPVLPEEERASWTDAPSGVVYSGEPVVTGPVLPVMVWGAAYDLDLVIVSRHPEWNMHEIARIQTPDGPLWLAKDARESTRAQSVVVDLEDPFSILPELPVERAWSPVRVVDRSTREGWLDLDVTYVNIDGDPVEITYQGKTPRTRIRKRNGNTQGHSRDAVLVALDLPQRDFARRATVKIAGRDYGLARIAGLLPFRMALVQTQGGLAVGTFRQTWTSEGFETHHQVTPDRELTLPWTVTRRDGELEAVQTRPLRRLVYRFRVADGGARELVSAQVEQFAREAPTTRIVFSPALPDLGRRFQGRARSRYAMDINGQRGHAVGWVETWWSDDGPRMRVEPEQPRWTLDRPMAGAWTLGIGEARAQLTITREESTR